ncbi:MAG: hypothetical protein SGI92_11310 [Bryobacteraceae bacterium]|nr:hypothetical protein [Bryobacteraceae bacterium]
MPQPDKTPYPDKTVASSAYDALPLAVLLVANGLLRVAGGAGGVLVGLYLANAAAHGASVAASLVGLVGAISFGAELLAALPMGILSDAVAPRWLLTGGALLGAVATQLFGMSGRAAVFFLSRGMEGAFLLIRKQDGAQWLSGIFAEHPEQIAWVMRGTRMDGLPSLRKDSTMR